MPLSVSNSAVYTPSGRAASAGSDAAALTAEAASELAAEEAVEEAPPQPVSAAASIREATDRETNCLQCINKIPQKIRI